MLFSVAVDRDPVSDEIFRTTIELSKAHAVHPKTLAAKLQTLAVELGARFSRRDRTSPRHRRDRSTETVPLTAQNIVPTDCPCTGSWRESQARSVMLFLRNLQTINTIIVLGGLALCLVFMIQVKQIYNKNQKYNRYLGYKQYVSAKRYFFLSRMSNRNFTLILLYFQIFFVFPPFLFSRSNADNGNIVGDDYSGEDRQQIGGLRSPAERGSVEAREGRKERIRAKSHIFKLNICKYEIFFLIIFFLFVKVYSMKKNHTSCIVTVGHG